MTSTSRLEKQLVEEFDFVALRFAVELRARCTLDEATNTARLDSLGFRMIGPGVERIADKIDVKVHHHELPPSETSSVDIDEYYAVFK